MDVLDELTEEHHSVRALLQTLAETQPGNVRAKTFEALERALTNHMAIEERFVYPLVAQTVGVGERSGAENEHELTRAGLAQMRSLLEEPGFVAAVEMLQTGVGHHAQEEDDGIFPRLRKKAPREIAALGSIDRLKEQAQAAAFDEKTKEELYHQAQGAGIDGRSTMTKAELVEALTSH